MSALARRAFVVAVITALSVLVMPRPVAAAGGDVVQTANATYQLVPSKHVVQVSIDVRVENHTPDTVAYVPCVQFYWDPYWGWTPYDTTCPQATHYYVNQTEVFIEAAATHLTAKANAGSVTIKAESTQNGYRLDLLTFSKIYRGQVRTVHITYQLPGGAPRSSGPVRAGAAYASFCATGNGPDGGTVTVIVPSAFTFTTSGGTATAKTSGSSTTYRSGALADPIDYYLCLDGTNASAFARHTVTTTDGRPLLIEAWPEDPQWLATIESRARSSGNGLEALIGRPLPGSGPVTIQEASARTLGDYVGDFDPGTAIIQVSEDLSQGDTVAHEIAHTWFNNSLFSDTWLNEGSAEWAATAVNPGTVPTCGDPGPNPGGAAPNIAVWQFVGPRSTQAQLDAVQYEYAAACYIVTQIADAAGAANMRSAVQDMLDHKVPYEQDTSARLPAGPLTWRQWLDSVDEEAMVASGADLNLAQSLLQRFGVDTNNAELAARSAARQQYHEFTDAAAGWTMPLFISQAMAAWRFTDATTALQLASEVRSAAEQIDDALPDANAVGGILKTHFAAAASLSDLQTADRFAQGLLESAKAVNAAEAALGQASGPIEAIGLAGTDLTSVKSAAVRAVVAGDTAAATADAAQITQAAGSATESGLIRLGLVLLLLVVVAGAALVRRRRHRPVPALAATGGAVLTLTGNDPEPLPEALTLFGEAASDVGVPSTSPAFVGDAPFSVAEPYQDRPAEPRTLESGA